MRTMIVMHVMSRSGSGISSGGLVLATMTGGVWCEDADIVELLEDGVKRLR